MQTHGRDAHATMQIHGQDARATKDSQTPPAIGRYGPLLAPRKWRSHLISAARRTKSDTLLRDSGFLNSRPIHVRQEAGEQADQRQVAADVIDEENAGVVGELAQKRRSNARDAEGETEK